MSIGGFGRSWSSEGSFTSGHIGGYAIAARPVGQSAFSNPGNGWQQDFVRPHSPLGDHPQLNYGKSTPVKTVDNTTDVGTHGNFTNQDINGLIWGTAWDKTTLTFSFPTDAAFYGAHYDDPDAVAGFQVLTAAQQDVVRVALDLVSQYTLLEFHEITETASKHAVLRYAGSSFPSTSYSNFPDDLNTAGDNWFGNIRNTEPLKAGYEWDTYLHETGHALGLKHGQSDHAGHGVLPTEHNSTEYSIMDYHSYIGADFYYRNVDGSGNQSYMVEDISALQYIYGANFDTNSGNTVYTWSPTTGELFIDGTGQIPAITNTIYEAIWDGDGKDTYDLSNYDTNVIVDLRPGEWSTFSTEQLAFLDVENSSIRAPGNIDNANLYNEDPRSYIENANGGGGADKLTGNAIANTLNGNNGADQLSGLEGKDKLNGGGGNDKLTGGDGVDTLDGGGGVDKFVYKHVSDSTSGNYDTVKGADFSADKFDVLGGIDAVDNTVGNGTLNKATFDANLESKITGSKLGVDHAVLYTPNNGDLAGKTFLIVDQNDTAGYQGGEDLVILLSNPTHLGAIDSGAFI